MLRESMFYYTILQENEMRMGYMPRWRKERVERCIVACVTRREQRGTPRETTASRAYLAQVRLLPFDTLNVTYAYNFIIRITI